MLLVRYKNQFFIPNLLRIRDKKGFKAECFGWGTLNCDAFRLRNIKVNGSPTKMTSFYGYAGTKGMPIHTFHFRAYGETAMSCVAWLKKGDAFFFAGVLKYDEYSSEKKGTNCFAIDMNLCIPQPSFDAKEVTAGQRARTERANELKFLELSGEAKNLEEFSPF